MCPASTSRRARWIAGLKSRWTTVSLPGAPDAAAALVSQAIDLLLSHYVEPLNPADLYSTAYGSVVKNLQALGKAGQATAPTFTSSAQQDAATFKQAYVALMQGAGPDINQTIAAYNAIQAVVAQIDECHTYFMDPQQYKLYQQTNSGQPQTYAGIGVEISLNSRPATITKVFAGSPAQAAGLRPGDKILAVDGKDVSNMPAEQISPLVRGQPGTKVTLTIQRPGESAPRDFTVTRANISVPNFTSQVIDGPNGTKIGYMQLSSFYAGAEKDMQNALNGFKQQGVTGWCSTCATTAAA
jgi:C-terminal processing protease CtpA/Prc